MALTTKYDPPKEVSDSVHTGLGILGLRAFLGIFFVRVDNTRADLVRCGNPKTHRSESGQDYGTSPHKQFYPVR